MKKTINLIACLPFFFLFSCGEPASTFSYNTSRYITINPLDSSKRISPSNFSDVIDDLSAVKLISKESLILSGMNKITPIGDNFLFCDRRLSFVYLINKEGRVKKVSGFGNSPGLYLSTDDVIYNPYQKEIMILSNERGVLLKFDSDGNFKSECKLDFFASGIKAISKNTLCFFVNQNKSDLSGNFDILLTDDNGKIKKRGFDFSYLPPRSYAFTGGFTYGDSPLFLMPYNDSIFQISNDIIKLKYVVSFGKNGIPRSIFSDVPKFLETRFKYSTLEIPTVENGNYLQLYYNAAGRAEKSVVNIRTGKILALSKLNDPVLLSAIFSNVCGADGNYFFAYIQLNEIYSLLNKRKEGWDQIKTINSDLYEMIKKSSPLDNPIIVKFKYKF